MIPPHLDARVRAVLPDAFSMTVWAGSAAVLQSDNPIGAHLFAAGVRELVGHILHAQAPDDQIVEASWYKALEKRPTRRQRAIFAVQGGLSDETIEALGGETNGMHAVLATAIDDLNKRTHVRPNTLLHDPTQIGAFAEAVVHALLDFLQTISKLRAALGDAVVGHAKWPVFEKALEATIVDIDELATHHTIEGVSIENLQVVRIDAADITYRAEGTIHVELLYGSGSDRERGDGASLSETFPFTCELTGDVHDIESITDVSDIDVDTSAWFE